jgi:hypothetical protein
MSGSPGFGVMINALFGNNGAKVFNAAVGKTITSAKMEKDALHLVFSDGSGISIYDDGQSCCENRYMTCEDNLAYFVGAQLLDAEVNEGPSISSEWGEPHDTAFLVIRTTKGVITATTHNEHNGYYGGFSIKTVVEVSA